MSPDERVTGIDRPRFDRPVGIRGCCAKVIFASGRKRRDWLLQETIRLSTASASPRSEPSSADTAHPRPSTTRASQADVNSTSRRRARSARSTLVPSRPRPHKSAAGRCASSRARGCAREPRDEQRCRVAVRAAPSDLLGRQGAPERSRAWAPRIPKCRSGMLAMGDQRGADAPPRRRRGTHHLVKRAVFASRRIGEARLHLSGRRRFDDRLHHVAVDRAVRFLRGVGRG